MTPLGNRVVVEPNPQTTKFTPGGIQLPENTQNNIIYGKVVETGRGKFLSNGILIEPEVSIDDEVVLNKYAGVEVDGQLIVSEEDILAITKYA